TPVKSDPEAKVEQINVKVTDGNNELFFKIKRTTQFRKLIEKYCERQGQSRSSLRFLYEGERVNDSDTPVDLDMRDGDTIEVHQEQIGGA
ncbi:hypothetical protein CANCADRAFT_12245, partial [Tortispora caseinolytica NRRL Y-17796]